MSPSSAPVSRHHAHHISPMLRASLPRGIKRPRRGRPITTHASMPGTSSNASCGNDINRWQSPNRELLLLYAHLLSLAVAPGSMLIAGHLISERVIFARNKPFRSDAYASVVFALHALSAALMLLWLTGIRTPASSSQCWRSPCQANARPGPRSGNANPALPALPIAPPPASPGP